jgi:hypothetical protein
MDSEGAPAAAADALDKTAPLVAALLQAGLTEQQIVQDNWTALMSLPLEAVVVIMSPKVAAAVPLSAAMADALEQHVTLDVLKVKPSSPLSCEIWCRVVARSKVPFGLEVRGALLAVRAQATTADACEWWCGAVVNLTALDANQQAFGTAEVNPNQPIGLCPAWGYRSEQNNNIVGTVEMRDALVALGPQATTAEACQWWCVAICNLAVNDAADSEANKQLLGTAALRDALVAMRPRATTAEACQWWCSAICSLTADSEANKQLLGTAALRDALVALQLQATTADACDWWCGAIYYLTVSAANKQLFGVEAVHDALVALGPQATTAATCERWCDVIRRLTANNAVNQQLFGTAAVRDALVALGPHATTANACYAWCSAINNLVFGQTEHVYSLGDSPATLANLQLLRFPALRDAHKALRPISRTNVVARHSWELAAIALDQPDEMPASATARMPCPHGTAPGEWCDACVGVALAPPGLVQSVDVQSAELAELRARAAKASQLEAEMAELKLERARQQEELARQHDAERQRLLAEKEKIARALQQQDWLRSVTRAPSVIESVDAPPHTTSESTASSSSAAAAVQQLGGMRTRPLPAPALALASSSEATTSTTIIGSERRFASLSGALNDALAGEHRRDDASSCVDQDDE